MPLGRCPTIILSLFWAGATARGAMWGMAMGFHGVPIFKFAAPKLPGTLGVFFANLEELVPAFLLSGVVVVVVSMLDSKGSERLADVRKELRRAGVRK